MQNRLCSVLTNSLEDMYLSRLTTSVTISHLASPPCSLHDRSATQVARKHKIGPTFLQSHHGLVRTIVLPSMYLHRRTNVRQLLHRHKRYSHVLTTSMTHRTRRELATISPHVLVGACASALEGSWWRIARVAECRTGGGCPCRTAMRIRP